MYFANTEGSLGLTQIILEETVNHVCVLANNRINHKVLSICFVFSFQFFLQLLCISLVSLIFRNSARKCLILPAKCSPQISLILLEILPAEFIQAYTLCIDVFIHALSHASFLKSFLKT